MDHYVMGSTIKKIREQKKMTQKELANIIMVSDKTVSKWENGRGYPDIGILEEIAKALQINLIELVTGEIIKNENIAGNMRKTRFYVCPICQNVISSIGEVQISCCGITLPVVEKEESNSEHEIVIEKIEEDYYVSMQHAMGKKHYIIFMAYITSAKMQFLRLYPEQNANAHFAIQGHGELVAYCSKHGLFSVKI